ncbi:hypothetical protein Q7C36_002699 [Tachysurus vachellii]|uniref:Uncharacterized protein n=1 Tax=Tachysurus vachellii TaxID=175792 RepID=A0AA88T7L7_TACVA|nr:hypothetical protein Q7C36_002699 [Tachysurus vachellii]
MGSLPPLMLSSLTLLSVLGSSDTPSSAAVIEISRNHSATQQRFPPARLNQSYDVESPSLTPLRPRIRSGSEASEIFVRHNLEPGTHPHHSTNQEDVAAVDVLQDKIVESFIPMYRNISCKYGYGCITLSFSPCSPLSSGWSSTTEEQQKAACLLTAAARGFLTRRLLQTEKIKHLNKTIQNSRQVIHDFQAEAHQRKASFTIQNLKLQQRVRAQGSAESSEPEYTNHPSDTQTSESEEDFHRLQG